MTISKQVEDSIVRSSWIRKMFEQGAQLKAQHGPENVFDFSLGNPNLPPPEKFSETLRDTVNKIGFGDHAYMPNTGLPNACQAVADYLSKEQGADLAAADIVMTCGAAGGLNVILKGILDSGDEVITPAPFFVEYNFYASNHGGVLKTVPTNSDFTLDLEAMAAAIGPKTKAVLINSPNNPTGQIYDKESLMQLGQLLSEKSAQLSRTIYLISDEPYRKIVYDGVEVPSLFECYADSIVTSSYSKDISIPGERMGYVAISPAAQYRMDLRNAFALTNRVLGFVNAPALMQRVMAQVQGLCVDVDVYKRNRDLLCDGLNEAGFEIQKPPGAFYLFPKTPIEDDAAFANALQKELILTVPGSGFGRAGHIRITYCVDEKTVINSIPGFKRVMAQYR
jgi:aspartate aminotransferase